MSDKSSPQPPEKTVYAKTVGELPVHPVKQSAPAQVGDINTAPTTTAEEDTVTAGQRRINLLWEWTQAILAIVVTGSTLYVAARLALSDKADVAAFLLLSNAFFSVISVYLTRTNHTKTGGVKPGDSSR